MKIIPCILDDFKLMLTKTFVNLKFAYNLFEKIANNNKI